MDDDKLIKKLKRQVRRLERNLSDNTTAMARMEETMGIVIMRHNANTGVLNQLARNDEQTRKAVNANITKVNAFIDQIGGYDE